MNASAEKNLIVSIRNGEESVWKHVIETYEGRLQAFAYSRLNNKAMAEDVVQETFIGFLTSLPNYDEERTTLESFLFRIAAYKITDVLRKQGRRPSLTIENDPTIPGRSRKASSMARSREGADRKKNHLLQTLSETIQQWMNDSQYERIKCCELLFVRGWPNKKVSSELNLTEQQVANHKQALLTKLKDHSISEVNP
ncbi:sigma-70 family RNA polymerase sigma factor [uncultured Rubinisphaera sp.]|uniref:RNA polymerase sigma factor n=1 Tax=uncultured Rubinisphaera sp. TaxID=1678686 RepID=UPI000EDE42AE|nr:RNA polymerase subunit sigma-70 [Planctomycetaceae bacterium]|tara:strand:- start:6177 stop:6767 length:591 start_codon:yes stop_codon:yes gene_type:complete